MLLKEGISIDQMMNRNAMSKDRGRAGCGGRGLNMLQNLVALRHDGASVFATTSVHLHPSHRSEKGGVNKPAFICAYGHCGL